MPLIKVQTSAAAEGVQVCDFLQHLSARLATHTGKPETYVMTILEFNPHMTFGGSCEPTCYIEVKNVGTLTPTQTSSMSQDFCSQVEQALGVAQNRTYIEFNDAKGYLWGWNGTTFG
jgi:phenylpyruvate tautomerase PptA (4-oxalocrotonate tautomerase family)